MKLRLVVPAAIALSALTLPGIAEAYWGQTTTALNVRTCASMQCQRIAVLAPGSQIWVSGNAGNWYQVQLNGQTAFVSAYYVTTRYASTTLFPSTRTYSSVAGTGYGSACTPSPFWDKPDSCGRYYLPMSAY